MAKKVLVIDDEHDLARAVELRLKATGYETEVAHDGVAGVDKAKKTKPNMILLDLVMPKMDGFEVCKSLKSDPETKDIPILIFTAFGQKKLEEKCKAAGAVATILKPFETNDLLNMINQILTKE